MKQYPLSAIAVLSSLAAPFAVAQPSVPARPNVLFIVVDDMNYDTPGAFGGKVPDITPNIDRLAREGRRFLRAHVAVGVCQPSRECIMTGSFPQTNGATGFIPIKQDVATLEEQLKAHDYYLGILGKVTHLMPAPKFPWDFQHDMYELGAGRDPERYYSYAQEFFTKTKATGKSFLLMANSHDPHRPFAGSMGERPFLAGQVASNAKGLSEDAKEPNEPTGGTVDYPEPNRIYKSVEIPVPGFLPDLPDVRTELAQYYSSAHRGDETVGKILQALDESGLAGSTLVIFLSDNGISMPFAKSNCYLTSTRTPCIIRWPGKVAAGSTDAENFVSGTDFMPTILEAAGLPLPSGMDGRSFLPLLIGGKQDGRDHVFTCYNDTAAKIAYPMRCVQNAQFGYIFNAWSDGKKTYRAETMMGLTFKAMQTAAKGDPEIAKRVELLLHRVPEEFYDLQNDPDALHNLINDPKYKSEIQRFRADLLAWMKRTHDPVVSEFVAKVPSAPSL